MVEGRRVGRWGAGLSGRRSKVYSGVSYYTSLGLPWASPWRVRVWPGKADFRHRSTLLRIYLCWLYLLGAHVKLHLNMGF
jgi:hypothetical protein